jgi:hypothetical protein
MPLLRVLAIAPEIDNLPRLAQASEMTRLSDASGVDVDPLIGPLVTQERIQARLRNNSFDVVLWSGHGHNGRLLLPGGKEIEPRWLASEAHRSGATLVVLAVCDSAQRKGFEGFTDVLPASGISIVAMASEVGDTAAIDYDVALLHALANGDNLREAHRIGLEAIKSASDRLQPQLFMSDNRAPVMPAGRPSQLRDDAPPAHIEHRVLSLEGEVRRIWALLKPSPRQLVARVVFYGLLFGLWSMWMIKEVRDWLIAQPAQAIVITLAMFVAALIIRWLPESDHDER